MLELFYNNEPIDLGTDDDAEMQQTSPLFNMEQGAAEYSTPITIKYTDRNNRNLAFYFLELTRKQKTSLNVSIHENGSYMGRGQLVIESSKMHAQLAAKGELSGYLLLNVSDFFQSIKDKKLTELSLGGLRAFAYTTGDPTDGSAGYWQAFQQTWAFNDDYVMLPVHNPNIDGNSEVGTGEWMNQVSSGKLVTTAPRVFPFIKLKYVLQQIYAEQGWTVDFSGLNDTDWEKLLLYPTGGLDVSQLVWHLEGPSGGAYTWVSVPVPSGVVYLYLNQFLDPNYTCSNFIIQLCYRFGWAPITDSNKKICRFVALKENESFAKKDWTKYAQPNIAESFNEDPLIFSFKNNFTGNDGAVSSMDLSEYILGESVPTKFDLPSLAAGFYDNVIIYTEQENQYWIVEFNETTRDWVPLTDNMYDDEAEGSNMDISTDFTPLPVYWTLNETRADVDYYILCPYAEQSRLEAAGLRILFYWGLVKERLADNSEGTYTYPFGSSVPIKPDDTDCGSWANVFKFSRGGTEKGIEEYWFRNWIETSQRSNDVVRRFNLPLYELINFKWDDKILCNNLQFLVKAINRPTPYTGYIEATLRRLFTSAVIAPEASVYLRKEVEITITDVDGLEFTVLGLTSYFNNATLGNAWVRAYSDAAGTESLSTDIIVNFRQTTYHDGVQAFQNTYAWPLSGTQMDMNQATPYLLLEYDYTNDYGQVTPVHVQIVYELLPGDGYTVIP